MSSVLTALKLIIEGDAKGGVRALKDLDRAAGASEKSTGGSMKALKVSAVAAAAAVGGIALVLKSGVSGYNDLGREITGVLRLLGGTTEEASQLVGVMRLLRGEDVDVAGSLAIFSKNLGAAQQGGGTALEIFKKLGIELRDLRTGELRSGTAVFAEFRDKISAMNNVQERNYYLNQVVGRSYREMLSVFTKTSDEIGELTAKVKDMGLVWGDKQLKTWGEFSAASKELEMRITAFKIAAAQGLVPALVTLTKVISALWGVLRPFAGVLKYVAVALAAYVAVVWTIAKAQQAATISTTAWAVVKRLLARVTGQTIAAELVETAATTANTVATEANTAAQATNVSMMGRMRGLLGTTAGALGVVGLALAATTFAIYEAVKAWQAYNEAAKQAESAYQGAKGTLSKAVKAGKTADWGTARGSQGSESAAQIRKEIERDKFKRPDWYNPITWFGDGGSFKARRPTIIGVGEKGTETVTVTPEGKEVQSNRGPVFQLSFAGANFYGAPTRQAAEQWAQAMREPLGRIVRDAMMGGATG